MNYYNEIDPYAAQWLRNLIAAGEIPNGVVDERSIEDVLPNELLGYTQCHFFAGIAGWSYALKLAGWPEDRPVWTGSCPCQPFSSAGKRAGVTDERHLWPAFFHLIQQCRPAIVFGEQTASSDGFAWLDIVQTDLENSGYTTVAADLCAAGVGAPHIRQRLYWVGYSESERRAEVWISGTGHPKRVANASPVNRLADSNSERLAQRIRDRRVQPETILASSWETPGGCSYTYCRDGKYRPIEPSIQPLAYGVPGRVGRLRAYGNAIVPQVAAEFIKASIYD